MKISEVGEKVLNAWAETGIISHAQYVAEMNRRETLKNSTETKDKTMSNKIHPAPNEFTDEQLGKDPILQYFHYAHLPEFLKAASKPFCDLAKQIITTLPRNPERSVALRKLLEAKDAAVRANVR